jgi:hypothetical protein
MLVLPLLLPLVLLPPSRLLLPLTPTQSILLLSLFGMLNPGLPRDATLAAQSWS